MFLFFLVVDCRVVSDFLLRLQSLSSGNSSCPFLFCPLLSLGKSKHADDEDDDDDDDEEEEEEDVHGTEKYIENASLREIRMDRAGRNRDQCE